MKTHEDNTTMGLSPLETEHIIYITLGGRGGMGKTTAALLLANMLRLQGREFKALDCDTENSGKTSAFGNYIEAERINLRIQKDCDKILEHAATNTITIADLPANASGDIMPWVEDALAPEILAELKIKVVGLASLSTDAGSAASIFQWAGMLQDRAQYIVFLNRKNQDRVGLPESVEMTFPEYFGSKTGQNFRNAFKPAEIVIEKLVPSAVTAFCLTGKLPCEVDGSPMPVLDRHRIKNWGLKVAKQLEGLI